jgi:hypothetical protein
VHGLFKGVLSPMVSRTLRIAQRRRKADDEIQAGIAFVSAVSQLLIDTYATKDNDAHTSIRLTGWCSRHTRSS